MFKIRRKSDGLFSTGGQVPNFTKGGKVWNTPNELLKHIALVNCGRWNDTYTYPIPGSWIYDDTEIVEFEMKLKNVIPTSRTPF